MASIKLSELSNSIDAAAAAGPGHASEETRKQLLLACERLRNSFESPYEFTIRALFGSHQAMALRFGVDLKLFDIASKCDEHHPIDIAQLAEGTGADPLLVTRVMGLLVAMGVFREVKRGSYVSTPLAAAHVSGSPLSSIVTHGTYVISILSQLPEYFKSNGWRNPYDAYDGPFQFATGSKSHYFDFLATHPHYQEAFNIVMKMPQRRRGQDWFEFFPVEEKLSVQRDSDVLFVDIGGNQGRDITELSKRFPSMPGKLILEDLPGVVDGVSNLPPSVQVQGYDFFDEQPVKGAKAYFLRTVLHDWPDKQARQILSRIHEAMTPESLLLINEFLLPESNVALPSSYTDWTMMAMFASLERTKEQFKCLLEGSGFELVNVWMPQGLEDNSEALAGQAALLEARLKQA